MIKKASSCLLPILGLLFITAYIRNATTGVIYTDYIRLVLNYLPDARSFSPYLKADILTRIPINYIERLINVLFFHYSTTFDMIMGALGLTFAGFGFAKYAAKGKLSVASIGFVTLIWFSLGQWEMLTNGSGWVHFLAVALFIYNYMVIDRVYAKEGKSKDEMLLYIMPTFVIVFVAGPYCAVYATGLVLTYIFIYFYKKEIELKSTVIYVLCAIIPLILYLISNHFAVYEYAGSTDATFWQTITQYPALPIIMFVNSFASTVLGGELLATFPSGIAIVLGLIVILVYVYTLVIGFKTGVYRKHILPLICIVTGVMNHILVVASRWIFMDENYAMSSRYALQYQIGTMGIVLTLMFAWSADACKLKTSTIKLLKLICMVFVIGTLITDADEINKAPYRQEHFIAMEEAAADYDGISDDELEDIFGYHDASKIREALKLLDNQKLNVYYELDGGKR